MIKAIITTDNVQYISRHDPGLDDSACDFEGYYKNFDEKFLAIKPGEAVTRWTIRPCSQTEVRRALGAASNPSNGMAMLAEVGAELLCVGLVGASDFNEAGDKLEWPRGIPAADLGKIPALVQIDLAQTIYVVSNGHGVAGGLEDEGKSPSPSSLSGQGNSTKSASAARTVKPTKASGGSGGARSLRRSKS